MSSSTPPQFAPEQEELFRDVLHMLKEHRVAFAVSGAFALHEHTGIWRNTKDLDVFLAPEDVASSMALLKERGLKTEVCDPVWLCKIHRDGYFVDLICGMSNAAIRVDQSWMDRSFDSEILEIPVKVLAPEELIASKIFVAFRERFDGADIAHVIYAAGNSMDWKRLLALVGEHSTMLLWALVLFQYAYPQANSVPKPIWDKLLTRFREELDHPNPEITFRGSLLDDRMFAIDVEEWKLPNVLEEYRRRVEPKVDSVEPAA